MNDLIRRAAGRLPADTERQAPDDSATDEQVAEWVAWKKAQPKPNHGSADGGARSTGPGMTAAQRMNQLILRATGRIR
jgi:hypothetical protein